MKAIIQAGGSGTRLRPYTFVLPKPLMPVGGYPVIETLLKYLRRNGIREAIITIGHLGHLIRSLCGDGKQWDMRIAYSEEPIPLGTVGPLQLFRKELRETFLVLNGDLITDLELRSFIGFHREHNGMVTIAATKRSVETDLGVIESEDGRVTGFREKPMLNFHVSMGIYCMEPGVLDLIPENVPFGFDDLMLEMLDRDLPVYSYLHEGIWMDIGRQEDFQHAQETFMKNSNSILGE
jgi:mannose-1-phosphate guanylyltransferase